MGFVPLHGGGVTPRIWYAGHLAFVCWKSKAFSVRFIHLENSENSAASRTGSEGRIEEAAASPVLPGVAALVALPTDPLALGHPLHVAPTEAV